MTITFRPAVRGGAPVLLGIAGPSRSGKTYSALRVATGLAQGGPIFFIDTESGRAKLYAERFKFLHENLAAPFTSDRYMEYIGAAHKAGAAVIIVDSASHEHEGVGGILEQHETELERMAGRDYDKRERMKFTAWIKPKANHNRYVNTLLQTTSHMIFCFRAKDKLAMVTNEKGKKEPVSLGWTPICTDRFEYEMTSMLMLPENARGVPDLQANSTGLREPIDKMVKPGQPLDEQFGGRLADWAKGQSQPSSAAEHAPPPEPGTARGLPPHETPEAPSAAVADGAPTDWYELRDMIRDHIDTIEDAAALKTWWKTDSYVGDLQKNAPEMFAEAMAAAKERIKVLETNR